MHFCKSTQIFIVTVSNSYQVCSHLYTNTLQLFASLIKETCVSKAHQLFQMPLNAISSPHLTKWTCRMQGRLQEKPVNSAHVVNGLLQIVLSKIFLYFALKTRKTRNLSNQQQSIINGVAVKSSTATTQKLSKIDYEKSYWAKPQ